ncbi:MAG: hypothetical protein P8N02_15235 [Actinomycetota bacterium]|nr:hypothetical protein [Actinomycetota bacterium]
MISLLFLGLAVLISLLGLLFISLRNRRSQPWAAGITDFQDRLDSLKPDPGDEIQWALRQVDDEGRTSAGS